MTEVPNIAGMYHVKPFPIPEISSRISNYEMRIDQEGTEISITTFFDCFYTVWSKGFLYEKDGLWYGSVEYDLQTIIVGHEKIIPVHMKMSDISDHKISSCYYHYYENASMRLSREVALTLLQKETYKFHWEQND